MPCQQGFVMLFFFFLIDNTITSAWQNQQTGMCAQQKLRSAWASTQTNQFADRMKKAWVLS